MECLVSICTVYTNLSWRRFADSTRTRRISGIAIITIVNTSFFHFLVPLFLIQKSNRTNIKLAPTAAVNMRWRFVQNTTASLSPMLYQCFTGKPWEEIPCSTIMLSNAFGKTATITLRGWMILHIFTMFFSLTAFLKTDTLATNLKFYFLTNHFIST